jgi:hypothetical protein
LDLIIARVKKPNRMRKRSLDKKAMAKIKAERLINKGQGEEETK